MNPKEGLRAVARNPWVQRGVLITTVLLSSEACIPRPETRPTPPPAPTSRPTEVLKPTPTEVPIIAVDAVKPDNLTGIEVKRGEILVFQASGTWCMGFGECGGPDGIRFPAPNEPGVIVPKEKIGTLLGAIKTKESPDGHIIFTIGRSREVEAEADGSLILLMNERAGYYRDNSGSLAVRIGKGKGSLGLVQRPQPTELAKSPTSPQPEAGWGFYTTLLYKIDVPTNWQLVATASPIQIQSGDAFDSFALVGPGEWIPVAQFTIQTRPAIQMSLDDYARSLREQLQREGDISEVKESRITIDRQPTIKFSYTRGRSPRVGEDYYFIRNGKAWMILTGIQQPGLQAQIKPIFDRMISSFRFLQ